MQVLLCTVPVEKAAEIAQALVEAQLAACISVIERVVSRYHWKGQLCVDEESLLVIKTREDRFEALDAHLRTLHPYEVYELVALPVAAVNPAYGQWVIDETRGPKS